jgi:hypothetical protein
MWLAEVMLYEICIRWVHHLGAGVFEFVEEDKDLGVVVWVAEPYAVLGWWAWWEATAAVDWH